MTSLAYAQQSITTDSLQLVRSGERVQLSMYVGTNSRQLPKDQVLILTPRLVGTHDSIDFPEVVVFGRNVHYHDVRQGTATADITPDAFRVWEKSLRKPGDGQHTRQYVRTLAHQPWMDHSQLKLIQQQGTPCDLQHLQTTVAGGLDIVPPDTVIVRRTDELRTELADTVSGQARIQFVVNRTDFNPELAANQAELDRMHASIDSLLQNDDVTVTQLKIKGYASPEGSYANNDRLARGRTERLRQYIVDEWGVPAGQVQTESEAEDWAGFRRYLEDHRADYKNVDAILSIIDSPETDLDRKLAVIQKQHPVAYRLLLENCFPTLRRTEYHIFYEWKKEVIEQRMAKPDTIIRPGTPIEDIPLRDDILTPVKPLRPWIAVKTNLLFDLLLAPNIELEMQLGRDSRWSIMVEDWFPWFLSKNGIWGGLTHGTANKMGTKNSLEVWTLGGEVRYWFRPRCQQNRPWLTGTFAGVYFAGGKYDLEWDSEGDQGEFLSAGLTVGRSWPLARRWNVELSGSIGAVWGPRRHYKGEFNDQHLIWQYTSNLFYVGPTKLKLSIVWLIGR